MEKYKLGDNIIITTTERYEKEFKALGYKPYQEPKLNNEVSEEVSEEVKPKRVRKNIKED